MDSNDNAPIFNCFDNCMKHPNSSQPYAECINLCVANYTQSHTNKQQQQPDVNGAKPTTNNEGDNGCVASGCPSGTKLFCSDSNKQCYCVYTK